MNCHDAAALFRLECQARQDRFDHMLFVRVRHRVAAAAAAAAAAEAAAAARVPRVPRVQRRARAFVRGVLAMEPGWGAHASLAVLFAVSGVLSARRAADARDADSFGPTMLACFLFGLSAVGVHHATSPELSHGISIGGLCAVWTNWIKRCVWRGSLCLFKSQVVLMGLHLALSATGDPWRLVAIACCGLLLLVPALRHTGGFRLGLALFTLHAVGSAEARGSESTAGVV